MCPKSLSLAEENNGHHGLECSGSRLNLRGTCFLPATGSLCNWLGRYNNLNQLKLWKRQVRKVRVRKNKPPAIRRKKTTPCCRNYSSTSYATFTGLKSTW